MTIQVYAIRQSVDDEDTRPDIVTYHDPNGEFRTPDGFKRFQGNCCVAAGKPGYPAESWFAPELYASKPGKTPVDAWDYYMCATFGAFSQRAMDVLAPYFGNRFLPLPARLEGHPYFCLHCRSRLDCLDRASSEIVYFDQYPQDVMTIERHVFQKWKLIDPMIFAIPELTFALFCTNTVPDIGTSGKLRGIEFSLVEG